MSRKNIFSKTSDTKTIIKFVREIEKYPCLYDPKCLKYMDRDLKKRSWIYIARKCNSTVADCKEKWTKVRTAYIRTLRPSFVGGVRTFSRPYYLASHLKFITPMKRHGWKKPETNETEDTNETEAINETETNKEDEQCEKSEFSEGEGNEVESSQHQVFLNDDNSPDDDNNDYIDDNGDDDDGYEGADDNDDDIKGYVNIEINAEKTKTNEEIETKLKETENRNEYDGGRMCSMFSVKRKSSIETIDFNPRKMFIFSLLPDIEDLNEQQMRVFRRDVIKLIDKVTMD